MTFFLMQLKFLCRAQTYFCVLLMSICLIDGQQVNITSSIGSGEHYCDDEVLMFTCMGSGTGIFWTVSPVIDSEGFTLLQTPPLNESFANGDVVITYDEQSPVLVSRLWLKNIVDAEVNCFTDRGRSSLILNSSTTPPRVQDVTLNIDTNLTMAEATWSPVTGAFDLLHYHVQLFINNVLHYNDTTTRLSATIILEGLSEPDVYVVLLKVSAVNDCDMEGPPDMSTSQVIINCPSTPLDRDMTCLITVTVLCPVTMLVHVGLIAASVSIYHSYKRKRSVHSGKSSEEKSNSEEFCVTNQ